MATMVTAARAVHITALAQAKVMAPVLVTALAQVMVLAKAKVMAQVLVLTVSHQHHNRRHKHLHNSRIRTGRCLSGTAFFISML